MFNPWNTRDEYLFGVFVAALALQKKAFHELTLAGSVECESLKDDKKAFTVESTKYWLESEVVIWRYKVFSKAKYSKWIMIWESQHVYFSLKIVFRRSYKVD